MPLNNQPKHQKDQKGKIQPVDLLVIQPTPFCNLDCRYCYLPDRDNTQRMEMGTIALLADRLAESDVLAEKLSIVWHAGEPLVIQRSFYEDAFKVFADRLGDRCETRHCFQTNATLINPEWCAFFKSHHISVGVSLDGPGWLHDRNRLTRRGDGTFEQVMAGVNHLHTAKISFHVIAVLTRESLDCPDEIFAFFQDARIHRVGFNIEEMESANPASSLNTGDARRLLTSFFQRLMDLNAQHGYPLDVREITGMTGAILGQSPSITEHQQSTPLKILCVDSHGGISALSPELMGAKSREYGDFIFGNLKTHALGDIIETPTFHAMQREITRGIERCRETCGYFSLCGGGAPGNKYFEHGKFDGTETMFCTLTVKAVADAVLESLEAGAPVIQTPAPFRRAG